MTVEAQSDLPVHYCGAAIIFATNVGPITRAAIKNAIAMWNKALGMSYLPDPIDFVPSNDDYARIVIAGWPSNEGRKRFVGLTQFTVNPITGCFGATIYIYPRMSTGYIYSVARHELGHILGLPDSPYEGDLMYMMDPWAYHPYPITELESLWARQIAGLEEVKMNGGRDEEEN